MKVPAFRVFRVWIGLDQNLDETDLRRLHEQKNLGVLHIPLTINNEKVSLERRL